nr:DUF4186 domain-containing protein [Acetobacter oeni]
MWDRLARSEFRAKFHLNEKDRLYLETRGLPVIAEHASDFIAARLAPAKPPRDGRQTPWRGHPVFVAQHATGTCCRSCLAQWHGFPKGTALDDRQQSYVVKVICRWLEREDADVPVQTQASLPL